MATATLLGEQALIERVLGAERTLRRAAVNAIIASRARLGTRMQLAQLISEGRIEEAVERSARQGAIEIAQSSAAVYVEQGQAMAGRLDKILDVTVGFDQVHDFAVERMRRNQLELVRHWTENQREIAHEVIREGIQEGINPIEQARRFRASTGLTPRQHQAVSNYRAALERVRDGDTTALNRALRDKRFDRTVRRAISNREPLTDAQINRMVDRYYERSIKHRAEMIARTEAMRSVNAGNQDALRQATADGTVREDEIRRTWVATSDERTRPDHVAADGQEVGMNEPFIVGGASLEFPLDPNGPPEQTVACRCTFTSTITTPLRAP